MSEWMCECVCVCPCAMCGRSGCACVDGECMGIGECVIGL